MDTPLPRIIDIDRLIRDATELQPLPQTVLRLTAILSSEDWDLRSIVDTLRLDPPMTARLLRAANSAAYMPVQPIGDVRRAVMHLGASQVASIAMGFAVRRELDAPVPAYGIEEGQLWRHSVAAALTAELCGRFCSVRVPSEAYVTALMHDIGKLVLARHLTPEIQELLARARDEGNLKPLDAEREVLGVHHGELGALVVQKWGLPESIVKGIMYHHTPEETEPVSYMTLAQVTSLADFVAKEVGAGLGRGATVSDMDIAGLRAALGMSDERYAALVEKVQSKLNDVLALYK